MRAADYSPTMATTRFDDYPTAALDFLQCAFDLLTGMPRSSHDVCLSSTRCYRDPNANEMEVLYY